MNNDTTNRFRFVHLSFNSLQQAEEGINYFIEEANGIGLVILDVKLYSVNNSGQGSTWVYQVKLVDHWDGSKYLSQFIDVMKGDIQDTVKPEAEFESYEDRVERRIEEVREAISKRAQEEANERFYKQTVERYRHL